MFSKEDKLITVYSYDQDTKEYVGRFEYFWAKDTGLAANSTSVAPTSAAPFGYVLVWDGVVWKPEEDHRDTTVYSTENKQEVKVDYLGKIKDGFTTLKPETEYQVWTGNSWVDPRTPEQIVNDVATKLPPLTRRQFKLALLENNLSDQVTLKISEIADPMTRARVQIEYEDSTTFERKNPSIELLLASLGLTEEQVNIMWQNALTY